MCQEQFERAEAIYILHPPTPTKNASTVVMQSPKGIRKGSAEYYKAKLDQSIEYLQSLENTVPELEQVPGLMPYKKVNPKNKTAMKRLTDTHGSMKAA